MADPIKAEADGRIREGKGMLGGTAGGQFGPHRPDVQKAARKWAVDLRRMYSTKPLSADECAVWKRLGERVTMARCAVMDLGRELRRLPPEASDG